MSAYGTSVSLALSEPERNANDLHQCLLPYYTLKWKLVQTVSPDVGILKVTLSPFAGEKEGWRICGDLKIGLLGSWLVHVLQNDFFFPWLTLTMSDMKKALWESLTALFKNKLNSLLFKIAKKYCVLIVVVLCIHLYNCSFAYSGSGKEKQPTLPVQRPQQPWLLLKL